MQKHTIRIVKDSLFPEITGIIIVREDGSGLRLTDQKGSGLWETVHEYEMTENDIYRLQDFFERRSY